MNTHDKSNFVIWNYADVRPSKRWTQNQMFVILKQQQQKDSENIIMLIDFARMEPIRPAKTVLSRVSKGHKNRFTIMPVIGGNSYTHSNSISVVFVFKCHGKKKSKNETRYQDNGRYWTLNSSLSYKIMSKKNHSSFGCSVQCPYWHRIVIDIMSR